MSTFFVTQKLWELQGKKIAQQEVAKARFFLKGLNYGTPSWKERLFGKRSFVTSHYRESGRKILMK